MSDKRSFSSLLQKGNLLKVASLIYQDPHLKPGAFADMQISPFHPSFVEQVFKRRPLRKDFASEGVKLETEHTWKFMHDPSQPELLGSNIWSPSCRQAPRWSVPKHIQQVHTNRGIFQAGVDETKISIKPLCLKWRGRIGKNEFWISEQTTGCYFSMNQRKASAGQGSHIRVEVVKKLNEIQAQELEQQCCLGPKRQPETLW